MVRYITNKLTTQIIKRRRIEKKMGHGFIVGNLFVTIKVFRNRKKVDSLLKITFDFIIRQRKKSYNEKTD